MASKYLWKRQVSSRDPNKMKESKLPISVKVFKTRKYLSDKKSNIRYRTKKIKENKKLKEMINKTKRLIKRFFNNLVENAENWEYRANADEGFIIDD